jgi:hypothetical protein
MNRRFASGTTNTLPVTIVKLDKSGGCVDRDETYLRQSQEAAIKEYFFGDPRRTLSPHTQNISFDEATIYRIRERKPSLSHFPFSYSPYLSNQNRHLLPPRRRSRHHPLQHLTDLRQIRPFPRNAALCLRHHARHATGHPRDDSRRERDGFRVCGGCG